MSSGEVAVQAAIVADVPFLGLPVISQIFGWLLGLVEGYFYTEAANAVTKLIIDLQTDSEVTATQTAYTAAQAAIASGDANAIQAASTNLDSAFASLIHSDGSFSA